MYIYWPTVYETCVGNTQIPVAIRVDRIPPPSLECLFCRSLNSAAPGGRCTRSLSIRRLLAIHDPCAVELCKSV